MEKYDVIVLGGGAAGLTCAIGAAKIGKKTLLIERHQIGGDCTWNGCIPSKAFILSQSLAKARETSLAVYRHETPEVLASYGVQTLKAEGRFVDEYTIEAGGTLHRAKNFILATGSEPVIPAIKGGENVDWLTNHNFFQLESLPKSLIFIGGGVISLELAYPLAAGGTGVSIIESADRILPGEDPEVRSLFMESLQARNIQLILGASDLEASPAGTELSYLRGGKKETIAAERIFASAGRRPRLEGFGLEQAGVAFTPRGILVNAHMQTSRPHIYAAGDCLQGPRFSHTAGRQGEVITRNLIFPLIKEKFSIKSLPFIVFTQPEYSRCGLNEAEARSRHGGGVRIYKAEAASTDRAIASGDSGFMLKVICFKGKILGAWCTGLRAAEVIPPLQFMIEAGIPFRRFASSMQAYPGYGEVIRRLSKASLIDSLLDNPLVKLFRK